MATRLCEELRGKCQSCCKTVVGAARLNGFCSEACALKYPANAKPGKPSVGGFWKVTVKSYYVSSPPRDKCPSTRCAAASSSR